MQSIASIGYNHKWKAKSPNTAVDFDDLTEEVVYNYKNKNNKQKSVLSAANVVSNQRLAGFYKLNKKKLENAPIGTVFDFADGYARITKTKKNKKNVDALISVKANVKENIEETPLNLEPNISTDQSFIPVPQMRKKNRSSKYKMANTRRNRRNTRKNRKNTRRNNVAVTRKNNMAGGKYKKGRKGRKSHRKGHKGRKH